MKMPRIPSARPIFLQASKLPLYIVGSTWRRHFAKSNGVTAVWVRPWIVSLAPCSFTQQTSNIKKSKKHLRHERKLKEPRYTHACEQSSKDTRRIVFPRIEFNLASLGLRLITGLLKLLGCCRAHGLSLMFRVVHGTPCRKQGSLFRRRYLLLWFPGSTEAGIPGAKRVGESVLGWKYRRHYECVLS